MSTLGEHNGNGNTTETSLLPKDAKEKVDGVLLNFDVLPSRFDRYMFKYVYVYLIGLYLPAELLFILLLLQDVNLQLKVEGVGGIFLESGLGVIGLVALIFVIWPFNVWRLSAPKTLRDLLEKKCMYLPEGDAGPSYLRFLEDYRNALASPKRYFLSGLTMIVLGILTAYSIVQTLSFEHLNLFGIILVVLDYTLTELFYLGGLYCIGIITWSVFISGRYVRKLVRVFELRIQPFHPDQCGGLKLLGNYCFGIGSPLLIGSGLIIGFLISALLEYSPGYAYSAVYLALIVGFPLLLLLCGFPVIVLAFILPLWDIHTKMVSEGEINENIYVAHMETLREEIQSLLDTNQVEEAKAVQEKKALVESLYTPYPSWPFRFRSKIFSTVLRVGGSLLIGLMAAALQQYFLPAILLHLFHNP